MTARYSSWLLVGCALVPGGASLGAGEKAGAPVHQRSLDDIKKKLSALLASDKGKGDENTRALQRLKAYRYLAEVPYEDLTLDEEYNKMCLAGAKLCEKLGKLEHKPENPGMPEEEFQLAYNGTSRSNLGWGLKTLVDAVDAWMFDSDSGNRERLGHRRWCLNPTMQKTGFGHAGAFTAMYTFDRSRKPVPEFDFICFPARGIMPIEFFGPKFVWSVSLNPKRYTTPDKDFTPKIYEADASGAKRGEPLQLAFKNVDTIPFGIPNCIIFRPENLQVTDGRRYVVELAGIMPTGEEQPVTLRYVVEFAKWK
jgi:hypothetical protein